MTAVPGTVGPWPRPGAPGRHGHLWSLPDGTGLHAPPGRLVAEEGTGRLCCHLCGEWFVSLGVHVRVHGHTAGTYREAMRLPRATALVAARPARRGGRAGDPGDPGDPKAATAAGTGPAGRPGGPAESRDMKQRAGGHGIAPRSGADEECLALRPGRSEGWTIIVTAAAGWQGSDWARWLLREARAR